MMFIIARSILLLICISRSYSAIIESLTIGLTFISRIFSSKFLRPKFTSKAFDSLNHRILLGKLGSLGVSDQSLRWFKSYFSERKQSVVINGSVSDPCSIQLGVPQGSILGPLLFNIYINSLPNATKDAKMILYADDAVLLCAASTAAELKEYLDTGFTQICTWYCENKLTLNVKKTKLMLTGSKNTLSAFENFEFKSDGVVIDRVKSFTYLGVTTD